MCYAIFCPLVANSVQAAGTQEDSILPCLLFCPWGDGSHVPGTDNLTEKVKAQAVPQPRGEPQLSLH